jgi:hypothetical protein
MNSLEKKLETDHLRDQLSNYIFEIVVSWYLENIYLHQKLKTCSCL